MSCGTVGPPVAPESIGVNVKRQKDLTEQARLQREAQLRKEEEEGKKPASVPEKTTGQSTDAEPEADMPELAPGKFIYPSAQPTGDVFVMPR